MKDDNQSLETLLGIQEENIQDDLSSLLSRASPRSCHWLQKQESFRIWLISSDDINRVLWLTGPPGTGKSILAAKTIDHIHKAIGSQYHFFMETVPTKRSAAYFLRSMAFQLAKVHPAFADRLIRLHQDTKFSAASQKFDVIWNTIFENIIFKMDFGSTLHWVIDGLDEADLPSHIVRNLMQMQSRTCIKLLLLSRSKRELTSLVGPWSRSVVVEPISIKNTRADIRGYINSVVSEILPQDKTVQKFVIQQITSRAEGSFLWTKLALDSLWDNWHTEVDIKMALNNVPQDMQALYQRMIDNVKGQSPRLQEIALRVLTWASCAFRPLTIPELVAALRPEFDGFMHLGETVVQICGQFIRVDNDTISLIHSTARQFLLHSSNNLPAAVGLNAGHDHLAVSCLQYLSQDAWRQSLARVSENRDISVSDRLEPLYKEFPFLRYAVNFWAYHVSLASVNAPSLLLTLRLFCTKYILQWVQVVALSDNIPIIPKSAQYLKRWLRRKRKVALSDYPAITSINTSTSAETAFLEHWIADLIRIVGKFGANLVQSPSTIHRHIPPFCPEASIIARTYGQHENPLITIEGLSADTWDDNLARLSPGHDEIASVIRCAGTYFFMLICRNGTAIVCHMETCEELRRIHHEEWVTLMETNKTGSLVVTGGRLTNKVWDSATGQQLYSLPKHTQARTINLDFAKLDTELVVAYDDCSVVSYNLEVGNELSLFVSQRQDSLGNCPRFMVTSPDQTQIAIGYRGKPVLIWDMAALPGTEPRRIIRTADKDLLENGEDVYNSPEVALWHPDGSSLYILYQDTTIISWNFIDDVQVEFGHTEAREIVINTDGTCLLTSSNNGSVSVWGIPKLNLIYRLHSDEFVRDLAFSPDGQRIYDVRSSGCNVWAPDALIRPDELEREEMSSSFEGSTVSEAVSEPVFAEDQNLGGRITALTCDDEDEFFCCGRDDGSVAIHEMKRGGKVRKVASHSATVDIVAIEWSSSRRFIASADDSGKIMVKRLKIKEDGKWAVFRLFEVRIEEALSQILFSPDESLILISTETVDHIWDLKNKTEVCRKSLGLETGRKWINHPDDEEKLIWLDSKRSSIRRWRDLSSVDYQEQPTADNNPADVDNIALIDLSRPTASQERINAVVHSSNHQYLLYETLPERPTTRRALVNGKGLGLVQVSDLATGKGASQRRTLENLAPEVQQLLGTYRERVVFLDHSNWICTWNIAGDVGSVKRHYFLPRNWFNEFTARMLVFNKHGALLCAKNGEVAIVRYWKGF